jgi:hypothetical protein
MTLEMIDELFWWVGAIICGLTAVTAFLTLCALIATKIIKQCNAWCVLIDYFRFRHRFKEWLKLNNQTKQP